MTDVKDALRDVPARGLRRRLVALAALRDTAMGWTADEYDQLSAVLMPYTDALLHELARKEQGENYVPYPHPMGEAPTERAP